MFEFHPSKVATAKNDILSGLTVALALVPEAVAFAFVAGVDPLVGLYAAFMVGLITACIGGRPGMISGATGALAVVMVSLVALSVPAQVSAGQPPPPAQLPFPSGATHAYINLGRVAAESVDGRAAGFRLSGRRLILGRPADAHFGPTAGRLVSGRPAGFFGPTAGRLFLRPTAFSADGFQKIGPLSRRLAR